MNVNVTMLVCNRPRLTQQALRSLGHDDERFSVTISEDRKCDDETKQILSDYAKDQPRVHLCGHTAEYGTGSLRNQVIAATEKYFGRGDYLYLSDNDTFFYPAIFEKLVPIYEYVSKAFGFRVLGAYNHPFHQPTAVFPIYGGGREIISSVKEVQALALQSMLMTWDVWEEFGPFNETPVGRVCMGEDVDFCHKINAKGGKLGVVSPPLVVNTGITNSFGEKIPGWELVAKEAPLGAYIE